MVGKHLRKSLVALLVTSSIGISSCALFGPGPEIVHAKGFESHAPASWKNIDPGESDSAYRLPSNDIATLTSSCHGHSDASLEILTRHLLFGSRNVKVSEQRRVSVNGVPALRSEVHETMEGKPFHLILVVLSKNGCVFDFSLVSNKAISSQEDQEFMKFAQSFSF